MSKFKVGDKVIRVGKDLAHIKKGGTYTVESLYGNFNDLKLRGITGIYDFTYFELVNDQQQKYESRKVMNKTEARIALCEGKKVRVPGTTMYLYQDPFGDILDNEKDEYNGMNNLPVEGWKIYKEPDGCCSFCGEAYHKAEMMKGFGEIYICNNCKDLR